MPQLSKYIELTIAIDNLIFIKKLARYVTYYVIVSEMN